MSLSWFLMQTFLRAPPPVPQVMTFSALIATSYCLVAVSSYRPVFQYSSRRELTDVLHHALDWP